MIPKIAHILQDFNIGGIQTCLFNIASRLAGEFEFHFIATCAEQIQPSFYKAGKPVYIKKWSSLIEYLRKERIDLVQVHNLRQYADCAMIAEVPVIVERTAGNRSAQNSREGIDWVIASNVGTRRFIEKNFDPSRVSVIYNGVDTAFINSFAPDRLGFKDSDIIIGRVSRVGRGQNLGMLIEAVKEANKKFPNAKLIIVGDKSPIPGADDIMYELKEQAAPLGADAVFTGQISEPFGIMRGFDIATCVSNHEGIPNSLLEAMACSKAVVSTNIGQIPELVTSGHNGLLIPPNDTRALVCALEKLASDSELRRRLGRNAHNTIFEKFNIDIQARKYGELYRTLLEKKAEYSDVVDLKAERKHLFDLVKMTRRIIFSIWVRRDMEFFRTMLPRSLRKIMSVIRRILFFKIDPMIGLGKFKWCADLCAYYSVTPKEAQKLAIRIPQRRPNLPGSATTHSISGLTLEEIWLMKPRDTINEVHQFYKDMGAWATFRQCYYHRKMNARHFIKKLKRGSSICEYGCGVAPITNWIVENINRGCFDLTIVDVESEHFHFAQWRLNKKNKIKRNPFNLRVLAVDRDNLPLTKNYDLILILDVFEHLFNAHDVARHLVEHLNRGGLLYENYIACNPCAENLKQSQEQRQKVFECIKGSLRLVNGPDPDRAPSALRCWKKL